VVGTLIASSLAALSIQPVASGFDTPVQVVAPKNAGNVIYVVEQTGAIWRLAGGKRALFMDIRPAVRSGGEQGLLGLAFHPRFAQNKRFYLHYTDTNGNARVVEYRSNAAGTRALMNTRRQLWFLQDPYSNHNAGDLQFGPDGKMYVGMGDAGAGGDPENRAQNLGSLFGKMLTFNVDTRNPKPQVVGLGLRNPWRYSFDRATGDLYIADVGQGEWEEIDYLPRSSPGLENFGWDVWEGNEIFEQKSPSRGKLIKPVAVYDHGQGCSVTGGFVYRGKAVPAAVGRYFYGDYCSGNVWSLKVVNGRATTVRKEPFQVESLSSFGEDAAGELYLISHSGAIFRLAR
jgi:glucose/arabinose dehydrogenase